MLCAVPMSECHPYCVDQDEEVNAAYAELVTAAAAGKVSLVLSLAPKLNGYVFFNAQRRSIQIVSCNRADLVANLPVRDSKVLAMAMALPTSGDWLRGLGAIAP